MTSDEPSDSAPASVAEVVARIADVAEREARPSLGDIVQALGRASFVPVLMAPAIAVVSPLSGIPLFSTTCGFIIVLVAAQMALGRRFLWLPQWLMRRSLPAARLRKAADFMRRPAAWLDDHTAPRLRFLVTAPMNRLIHLVCLLCGAVMPTLELLPFMSSILGAAVLVLALALLVRDGLIALMGLAVIGAAIAAGVYGF